MLSLIYTFGTAAAVAAVAWALIEVWELFDILTEGEGEKHTRRQAKKRRPQTDTRRAKADGVNASHADAAAVSRAM